MNTLQKGTILIAGIVVFVFALSIGLSWYSFGFMDWSTVSLMVLILLPILGAATAVFAWSEKTDRVASTETDGLRAAKPATQANPLERGI